MAAQCDVNTAVQQQQQQHFISSNVYHGYVPVPVAAAAMTQNFAHRGSNDVVFASDGPRNAESNGMMDVDAGDDVVFADYHQQQQQQQQFYMQQQQMRHERCFGPRKRAFDNDDVAAYMPCFKRFREGGGDKCFSNGTRISYEWCKDNGFTDKVYDKSPLLRLSPAADSDMICCGTTTKTVNHKIQPVVHHTRHNSNRWCQEYEDMLLLTHGCSSYHYQHTHQLSQDGVETEF